MKNIKISFLLMLVFSGAITAQSQNDNQEFLNAQFLILDKVQPLTLEERDYMERIFYEEFAISSNQEVAFKMAMSKALKSIEYFESYYSEEIDVRTKELFDEDLVFYSKKMGLDDASLEEIKPHLNVRSRYFAIFEVCLFAYPETIIDAKEEISAMYYKKISDVYIKKELKEASYDFRLLFLYREFLELENEQIDSIVIASQIIKQLTAESVITQKENNSWLYERSFIMEILVEEQVFDFVVFRNADYALNYAEKMWNEGKSYQMESKYDSVQIVKELFGYQTNWAAIQYIYHDEKEKIREKEEFLYEVAYPEFLKQLAVERRKRGTEEDEDLFKLVF